ncbi:MULTISPECIES: PLDc N-terminal domain-containing protein [Sphingobacterium]|uniref:PLDc N-terminal domain-containing protein n=1 Tax=Sphingobacterium populi TaxID=1812824 RepID=A0ABW5UC73_9SPHI
MEIILLILHLALVVYAIYRVLNSPSLSSTSRLLWIIGILIFPFIGSIAFLVFSSR